MNDINVGTRLLIPGLVPSAVVLTSDGVPNSFSEPEGFLEFCGDIAERARNGVELERKLSGWLAEISLRGSGDDMSVARTWVHESGEKARGC